MVTAHDVAHYMLRRRAMTAMKLQKLLYYAQGWHLALTGHKLFREPIQAWANGPVVRDIYDVHRGSFGLSAWPLGDEASLTDAEKTTVDLVLDTYGRKDARWLSELTHTEEPWNRARSGLPEGARSEAKIGIGEMRSYFTMLRQRGMGPREVVRRG
jgi:uncharacterized phage-associated protein